MLTRRNFIVLLPLSTLVAPVAARAQESDSVTVRIRTDDSVRDVIPPIFLQQLTVQRDNSEQANELVNRAPKTRAVPVILIIVGALTIPILLQMIREQLRQIYYGGLMIDMRSTPPSITSDPRIPANFVFLTDTDGKTSQFTSDQLSSNLLQSFFKGK